MYVHTLGWEAVIIILEGPDGAGKTTLARRISEELHLEYRRNPDVSSTMGSVSSAGARWATKEIERNDLGGVYDRFWYISEIVYQTASLKPLISSGVEMYANILDLANADPIIVFCIPPWETSREIVRNQPEHLVRFSVVQLEKIHWAYSCLHAMWANALFDRVFLYDFTITPDAHNLIHGKVRQLLELEQARRRKEDS